MNNVNVRTGKISIGKAGGQSGPNTKYYRAIIPPIWAKEMGITDEDRDVILTFDGEKIVVRKAKPGEAVEEV